MKIWKSKKLFCVVLLLLITVVSAVYAVDRVSANYKIPVDGVTCGGGSSSSASYIQVDSVINQGVVSGVSSSAGYQNQADQIRLYSSSASIAGWQNY